MNLIDAKKLAHDLMAQHGLSTWTFTFDGATRRFGLCNHKSRVISLSKPLTELNSEERVRNTILHEIAHALTFGAGHSRRWRDVARRIGCDGRVRYNADTVVLPPTKFTYKWEAICDKCGGRIPRKKQTLGIACRTCCNKFNYGRYSPEYKFRWETI